MTNKNHFLAFLLFPFFYSAKEAGEGFDPKKFFSPENGAQVILNDSIRAWTGGREISHCTINPDTDEISWMTFPREDVKMWTRETVLGQDKFNAGRPGLACIDERTISEEFWIHNAFSEQNFFLYLHLIQDDAYDMFIHSKIDTSNKYADSYIFEGEFFSGEQLRGKLGIERWEKGLVSEIDTQFYVRLAKMYYEATGIKTDRKWLDEVMKKAIMDRYPADLGETTVEFISLSDKANTIIENKTFNNTCWPINNGYVDQWIMYLMGCMLSAMKRFYRPIY